MYDVKSYAAAQYILERPTEYVVAVVLDAAEYVLSVRHARPSDLERASRIARALEARVPLPLR